MTEPGTFAVRHATAADLDVLARHRVEMFRDMGDVEDAACEPLRLASRHYLEVALAVGEYRAWLAAPMGQPGEIVAGAGLQVRPMLPRRAPTVPTCCTARRA